MPQDISLPATGTINYKSILVKGNFPEDVWVVAADLRPGNAQAVHHMRAIVRPPGSLPAQAGRTETDRGARDRSWLRGCVRVSGFGHPEARQEDV